jgi:hypothetical protein
VTVSIIPLITSLRLINKKYNLWNSAGIRRTSWQQWNRAQPGDYSSQTGLFQPGISRTSRRALPACFPVHSVPCAARRMQIPAGEKQSGEIVATISIAAVLRLEPISKLAEQDQ